MRSRKAGGQTGAFTGPGRLSEKGGLADKRGHSPCAGRGLALRREGEPAATRRAAALKRPAAGLRPCWTEGCSGKGLGHRPNRKEIDGHGRSQPTGSRADQRRMVQPGPAEPDAAGDQSGSQCGADMMSSSIGCAWPRSTASSLKTADKFEGTLKARLQHPYRSHRPLPGPPWRAVARS